jgi:pimeloyl-ACP methyl ester carboxylesterase
MNGGNLRSKIIPVGNLDIHYVTGGEGPPLILIHGSGSEASRSWREDMRLLSLQYKVYAPDLPGFGRSQSSRKPKSLAIFTRFIDDFSRALGLEKFYLVGHSFGGGIVLNYALEFPEKVEKLVVANGICLGKEIALRIRLLSVPFVFKILRLFSLAFLKALAWSFGIFSYEFISRFPHTKIDMAAIVTSFRGQSNVLLDKLSTLLVPTLLVWGARDKIVPVKHAYEAAKVIPDCRLHVFQTSGHSVHKDKANDFCRLLTQFLEPTLQLPTAYVQPDRQLAPPAVRSDVALPVVVRDEVSSYHRVPAAYVTSTPGTKSGGNSQTTVLTLPPPDLLPHWGDRVINTADFCN